MKDCDRIPAPELPFGWQTGNMRKKERGGHHTTHNNNMHALADILVKDVARQITSGNIIEAAALVEANLIGVRQGKSGCPAVAASPDAQRILNEQEIPPLPFGWQTGSMRREEQGGSNITHDENIRELSKILTVEIARQVTNGNLAEAAALVEGALIGIRKGKKGPPAVSANPDAQRILSDEENRWRLLASSKEEPSRDLT